MKPLEDYIRKKLGTKPSPPNLDTEDLWAGISAGLPAEGEEQPIVPPHSPFWGQRFGFLLFGLLLLLVGTTAWWLTQPTDEFDDPIASAGRPAENVDLSTISVDVKSSSTINSPTEAATQTTSQDASIPSGQPTLTPRADRKESVSNSRSEIIPSSPVTSETGTTEQLTAPNTPDEASASPTDNEDLQVTSQPDQLSNLAINEVAGLAVINHLDYTRSNPTPGIPEPFRSTAHQRFSAGVHVGSNILLRKYATTGDDTGEQLNKSTGQMIGQTAAIDFRYRLADNLTMGVGIDYHRTGNTFQYVSEWDTLIPHPTPPNTGLIDAVARRSVAHNNREERLSIPLLLAYERQLGDFTAGLGAGLGLNWQTKASGRTLNTNGRIVNYDAPLQSSFFLSWQVQPRLSWQPATDKPWAFQLRLDAARFTIQQSAVTGVQQRGWLFGAALGVRYRLGR